MLLCAEPRREPPARKQFGSPAIVALQQAAYARNRVVLGVEPLPLQADYAVILATYEVWLAEVDGAIAGVLVLQPRPDDLLIWSVAAAPAAQGRGLGNKMLEHAEMRTRQLSLSRRRLYTGEPLTSNIAWYERHSFVRERIEALNDRKVVHMVKTISGI